MTYIGKNDRKALLDPLELYVDKRFRDTYVQ